MLPVLAHAIALAALFVILLPIQSPAGTALPSCPPAGGTLRVALTPHASTSAATAVVFGTLSEPSCSGGANLSAGYARLIFCDPAVAPSCQATLSSLQPGRWTHRILVFAGEGAGQMQGRQALLLATAAGQNDQTWPLYASVTTVGSLVDAVSCAGCLRAAIQDAEAGAKPALVQFATGLAGTITLAAPLPPLSAGRVTLDGFDFDGRPQRRTIDANALPNAALRITGSDNVVSGLRVVNVGGDSDAVLIDGTRASRNLLESLLVIGRSVVSCGGDQRGCLIDGVCRTAETDPPFGVCGDDGIAARGAAGTNGVNVVRACEVIGAFDKGIKVSNAAVARVERCFLHGNADGGLQATLGGSAVAVENVVEENDGTLSANGLAANGPEGGLPPAARLETRGNLVRRNALRGISVRSLSFASLRHDYVCGNGTAGREAGFGIAVLDAAGLSAEVEAEGIAVVHNVDGGIVVSDASSIDLGGEVSEGRNAIAFNGPDAPPEPVNLRNLTALPISAVNDQWESCGDGWQCDVDAVLARDVVALQPSGAIEVEPAMPGHAREPIEIDAVEPTLAAAGDLVRIYGRGFDAIDGNDTTGGCDAIASANGCDPLNGNCVVAGGREAEVVAVTPTMLVVRAPFTCVEPVRLEVRSRKARGIGRATFCRVP